MRGKGVPKGVAAHAFGQAGGPPSVRHGPLNHRFMQVEAGRWPKSHVAADAPGREYKLPRPLGRRIGKFTPERVRQCDASEAGGQIEVVLSANCFKVRRQWSRIASPSVVTAE